MAAQLADGPFEDCRVLRHGIRRQPLEQYVARKIVWVVALRAVLCEQVKALSAMGVLDTEDERDDGYGTRDGDSS